VFNQGIGGMPGALVRYLTDIHPARNPGDVENYLRRLSQVAARVDEMIVDARARASRGIVPPRFILTATIDQIERLAAPEPGNNVLVESYDQRIAKVPSISEVDSPQVSRRGDESSGGFRDSGVATCDRPSRRATQDSHR
jgi:uncharacterized protein (DUF885 family)